MEQLVYSNHLLSRYGCFHEHCAHSWNTSSLFLDHVAHLPPGLNRLLEQFRYWSITYICKVFGTVEMNGRVGTLSSSNPIGQGTPLNPHFVEGNKEKERTVKSGRNPVYGAPEHSCFLELAVEVRVSGKAAIYRAYSGICQMVMSFKPICIQTD